MKRLILLCFLPVQIAWATPDYMKLSNQLAERHIIPLYEGFASKTQDFAQDVNQFCQKRLVRRLLQVQESFKHMVLSWGRIQHINFGPIQYLDGYAKMQFFPDKKGFTQRKLRTILNDKNPDVLQEVKEGQETPPVQGLGAMEYLLFKETQNILNSQYHCQLLQSQAYFFQFHAKNTKEAWQTFYKDAFNSVEENNQEASKVSIAEMMKANLFALDLAASRQIGLAYAPKKKKGKPFYVQFPLSQISFEVLEQNLKTQKKVVATIYAPIIEEKLGQARLQKLLQQFDKTLEQINRFDTSLRQAVSQSDTRAKVKVLYLEARLLYQMTAKALTESLEIPIGFNALDGD